MQLSQPEYDITRDCLCKRVRVLLIFLMEVSEALPRVYYTLFFVGLYYLQMRREYTKKAGDDKFLGAKNLDV